MLNMEIIEKEAIEQFAEVLRERAALDPTFIDQDGIYQLIEEMKANLREKPDLFAKLRLDEFADKNIGSLGVVYEEKIDSSRQEEKTRLIDQTVHNLQQAQKQQAFKEEDEAKVEIIKGKQNEQVFEKAAKRQKTESEPIIDKGQQLVKSVNLDSQIDSQYKDLIQNSQQAEKRRLQLQWQLQYDADKQLTDRARSVAKKGAKIHISAVYNQKTKRYDSTRDEDRISLCPVIIKTQNQEYLIAKMQGLLVRGEKEKVVELADAYFKQEEEKEIQEKMLILGQAEKY